MARTTIDTPLTTRAARERLEIRHEPYWRNIEGGAALGYRKGVTGGAWLARLRTPQGGYLKSALGRADDVIKENGANVLDFRQADSKARAWIAKQHRIFEGLEPESAPQSGPYTVSDAIRDYMADYAARGGKGLASARASANAHICLQLGHNSLGKLSRDTLKNWHRNLASSAPRVRSKKNVINVRDTSDDPEAQRRRRSTANRVLTILKAALNHARAEGKATCSGEAWTAIKPFRETDQPKIRYLLDDEAKRFVNACTSDFRSLVAGALLTGARYGELSAMRSNDFDKQAGTVTVAVSKSGKPRHIALTEEGVSLFARLTTGRSGSSLIFERLAIFKQATRDRPAETVRAAWAKSDQFRLMGDVCKLAKIQPAIGFHVLRHTYASRLASRGVPLSVIAAQLGHSDTRMTERHYAHLYPTYVADTVRAAFGTLGVTLGDNVTPFAVQKSA
jgi:integrase